MCIHFALIKFVKLSYETVSPYMSLISAPIFIHLADSIVSGAGVFARYYLDFKTRKAYYSCFASHFIDPTNVLAFFACIKNIVRRTFNSDLK